MARALPEPAGTYMTYVNDRNVKQLGPVLVPFLHALGADGNQPIPGRGCRYRRRARQIGAIGRGFPAHAVRKRINR
jgi:hypothetical protein